MDVTPQPTTSRPREPKKSALKSCFSALVDRKQLNLDMEVLTVILKKELCINYSNMDETLATLLPYMVVIYMKNWPGWQRSPEYFSGKLQFKDWLDKFVQYIAFKINYVVRTGYMQAWSEIKREEDVGKNKSVERGAQTDNLALKGFSPYVISISTPANMYNRISFCSKGPDDIIMLNDVGAAWTSITVKELINWPYIEVEFKSAELYFSRTLKPENNCHIRHFSSIHIQHQGEFIDDISCISPLAHRTRFSYELLLAYVKQFTELVETYSRDITEKKFEELCYTLDEFLYDVKEIKMHDTIVSNTSVLFNIGSHTYARNKMRKNETSADVAFMEYIKPRMELAFHSFTGIQDTTTATPSFVYLNKLREQLAREKQPVNVRIQYKCHYCNTCMMNQAGILTHLQMVHQAEPTVHCIKCKKVFYVYSLASTRWGHICTKKK